MRDNFSKAVRDALAQRVGGRCSNPDCDRPTTGPRTGASRVICLGVGAHITAASRGGQRYNPSLSTEQRTPEDNGIWLCQNCAKLVDNDEELFTVLELRNWKQKAEASALAELRGTKTRPPAEAVQLTLVVGGVVLGGEDPPRPIAYHSDRFGTCIRHDYALEIVVDNCGNECLGGYHVDVNLPTRALEHPEMHDAYVASRSTPQHAFFRARGGANTPDLFPGDASVILKIAYYVDEELYRNDRGISAHHVYKQSVRVSFYQVGISPVIVEMPFERLSNF